MFVCTRVSYQGKRVGDFAIGGQLSSKAVGRKELVAVVVLDYLSHCFQGHGISIHLVGVHIVERSGLGRVTLKSTHKRIKLGQQQQHISIIIRAMALKTAEGPLIRFTFRTFELQLLLLVCLKIQTSPKVGRFIASQIERSTSMIKYNHLTLTIGQNMVR